jgi:hypothetical protein
MIVEPRDTIRAPAAQRSAGLLHGADAIAAYLNLGGAKQLYRAIEAGMDLPLFRFGDGPRSPLCVRVTDLDQWIADRASRPINGRSERGRR